MGQVTPNIGIYLMAAGETNYSQNFDAGMINIDQHDHSGGPNKGVPISNSGLADFSVEYNNLNLNVANPATGIGFSSTLFNQLEILGLLKSIYQLATTAGFITKDGSNAHARTFQDTSTIAWTFPDGVGGNPSANLVSTLPTIITGTPNQIAVTNGAPNERIISLSPIVVNVTQPAFSARVDTNQIAVTGDGTDYKVLYPTVDINQGSYYDDTTSTFTAPIDGVYLFNFSILLDNLSTNNRTFYNLFINGSNERELLFMDTNPVAGETTTQFRNTVSHITKLSLGDEVTVNLSVINSGGAAKTINVNNGFFSGYLIC